MRRLETYTTSAASGIPPERIQGSRDSPGLLGLREVLVNLPLPWCGETNSDKTEPRVMSKNSKLLPVTKIRSTNTLNSVLMAHVP